MPNIYCGIEKPPKGHSVGSMKECAEKKQIRYWGIKKVDSKLLEAVKRGSKAKETRDKLAIKMVTLRARVAKMTKDLAATKDKKEKERLTKVLTKTKEEYAEVVVKFKKADKLRKQSRTSSRKGKKASSRKSKRKSKKSSRK